jgi:SWI/SNF-related matrix-associated actin-dependent regulator 1 of chromatin subfamily A
MIQLLNIPAPPGKAYLPYQLKAIRYAMGARGTIIADEMGLGKTVEAIGVINATPDPGTLNVLIICPAGLRLNWQEEIEAWLVIRCAVTVVSYHVADKIAKAIGQTYEPKDRKIDILIVDEAHYVKNPDSQRSQNVERIALHAKRVLLLTGTPMENRPIELWQLLKIACPEKWDANPRIEKSYVISPEKRKSHPGEGPGFWAFAERYCALKKVQYAYGKSGAVRSTFDFSGSSNEIELAARLRNTCMVRRLKRDVLPELPPKRRQLIVLESDANDADMFPNLDDDSYFDVLAKLTTDKVAFTEWSTRRHQQALQKVDACIRFIGDALDGSAKLIVFAHHTDVIEKLKAGIDCEYEGEHDYSVSITGSTPMDARQAAVDAFQSDPLCRVIIGSIGAMGVGWTLTAGEHVVFCELDPVPGRLTQAEDRAHRIGQKNSVLVQQLVANGSLCARMARIVARKQEVLTAVLDGPLGGTLTYEESSENDRLP